MIVSDKYRETQEKEQKCRQLSILQCFCNLREIFSSFHKVFINVFLMQRKSLCKFSGKKVFNRNKSLICFDMKMFLYHRSFERSLSNTGVDYCSYNLLSAYYCLSCKRPTKNVLLVFFCNHRNHCSNSLKIFE